MKIENFEKLYKLYDEYKEMSNKIRILKAGLDDGLHDFEVTLPCYDTSFSVKIPFDKALLVMETFEDQLDAEIEKIEDEIERL